MLPEWTLVFKNCFKLLSILQEVWFLKRIHVVVKMFSIKINFCWKNVNDKIKLYEIICKYVHPT